MQAKSSFTCVVGEGVAVFPTQTPTLDSFPHPLVTPRSLKADGLEAPLHTGCVGSVDTTQYEGGATISTDSLIHGCSSEVLHMPPLQAMHP